MRYAFYPGCSYRSSAGYEESVDAVNRKLGIEFQELSDWNCCGATVFFSRNEPDALALAGRILALTQAIGFTEIVTICNACYTTLKKSESMIHSDPYTLRQINEKLAPESLHIKGGVRIRHYLDVLYNDVPEDVWSANGTETLSDIHVAGYYGCQLTRPWGEIDLPDRPTILERFIKRLGFSPVEHSAKTLCCGASHFVSYADACSLLVSRIVRETRTKGADLITTVCPMCQFNLDAGQKKSSGHMVPVSFFTQLAGLSLGIRPERLGLNKLLISAEGVFKSLAS